MNKIVTQIKRSVARARGIFPETLPAGVPAFNIFVDSIIANYDLPTNRRDDVAYVIASNITTFSSTRSSASKRLFVRLIRAAAAKQVAGAAFGEIRERLRAEQKAAEEAAKQAAVTASPETVTNAPT